MIAAVPDPTFSVVLPAYNAASTLGEALDSLLAQDAPAPFEVIVVDDGSTDGTGEVARSRPGVRYVAKPNGGPASARNLGVRLASSKLILFLDSDDVALPGRFARQCGYMLEHSNVALSFGNLLLEGADSDYLKGYGIAGPRTGFRVLDAPLERLLAIGCFVPTSTVAIRRDAYLAAGGQPEDRRYAEDYALWCRVAAGGGRFACTGAALSWYRVDRAGRLTRSEHTHLGLVRTLREALLEHGPLLTQGARVAAEARYWRAVDRLLRHAWIHGGRDAVALRMQELQPGLPGWLDLKWRLVGLVPPTMPRAGLHWLRSHG